MTGQKHKLYSFQKLINRFPNPVTKIKELEQVIKKVVELACDCYGGLGEIGITIEEFEKILLLDGCYIIEMVRKMTRRVQMIEGDYTLFSNAMIPIFHHDLFLVENQIPWFVLERLFEHTENPENDDWKPLIGLTVDAFSWIFSYEKLHLEPDYLANIEVKHLLHLAWHYLGSSSESPVKNFAKIKHNVPSATRLKAAGVKFRRVESRRILDVRFNERDGFLEILALLIHPTTESIFLNLISFEQCLPRCLSKVTCYAKLLNALVDTPEDVELLSKNDIFNNSLNLEDVAHFINRLHNGTNINSMFYAHLCCQIDVHYRKWWPKWRAFYIHNYFSKPWAIVSQIFGIANLGSHNLASR